jgi:hypothetical protein
VDRAGDAASSDSRERSPARRGRCLSRNAHARRKRSGDPVDAVHREDGLDVGIHQVFEFQAEAVERALPRRILRLKGCSFDRALQKDA